MTLFGLNIWGWLAINIAVYLALAVWVTIEMQKERGQ